MSTTALISAAYTPAEAERGKFAIIDPVYLQTLGYPATGGYGRYAVFTYQINPTDLILSGGNVTVSSVQITNDVVIDHIIDPITVDTINTAVSSIIINTPSISSIIDPIIVSSITDPITVALNTTATLICSVTLGVNSSAVFDFNPIVTLVEIYNNSSNKIYFQYTNNGTFADVTGRGMIIDGESYYGMEKNIANLTVASISGSNVRIFAHRR